MKNWKTFVLAAVLAFSAVLTSGCGAQGERLVVFNVADYIDEDVIGIFEEEFGIKVVYDTYDSNESMYAKVKASGGYDILFPSDYMIERMVKEGMLQPINMANVPNASHIDDRFKNLPYDPNNEYSVSYMWGTLGIMYNTSMISEEITSWDTLWDPAYTGQIFMYDSQRDALAAALKRLGYSLNTTNLDELNAARDSLMEQLPIIQAYITDAIKDKMIGNEGSLALTYSGDVLACLPDNPDLAYCIPIEGSNLWFDGMVIPKDAKNKENAEKFINFMCRPEIAALNSTYIGYTTTNRDALEFMDEEITSHPSFWPDEETLDRCQMFRDLGDFKAEYDNAWNQIFVKAQ